MGDKLRPHRLCPRGRQSKVPGNCAHRAEDSDVMTVVHYEFNRWPQVRVVRENNGLGAVATVEVAQEMRRDCNVGELLMWQFDPCLPRLGLVACKVFVKIPQHLFGRYWAESILPLSLRRNRPPSVGHFELAFEHFDTRGANRSDEESLTPRRVGILCGFLRDLRGEVLNLSHCFRAGSQPSGKSSKVNPLDGRIASDRGIEVQPVYVYGPSWNRVHCRRRDWRSARAVGAGAEDVELH